MNSWQPFAQRVATLVLAGAVVFLGYQQGQPRNVDVSIDDMPQVRVDNALGAWKRQKTFNVTGCGRS